MKNLLFFAVLLGDYTTQSLGKLVTELNPPTYRDYMIHLLASSYQVPA